MKKTIFRSVLLTMTIAATMMTSAYGQGTKLSSFPAASACDVNTSLVGVENVSGSYVDQLYSMSQLVAYMNTIITFDEVLANGYITARQAQWTYGPNNLIINPTGITIQSFGTDFLNYFQATNSFVKDGSNNIWFAGGNVNGTPCIYIKDAGSIWGDTLTVAALWRGQNVAVMNNNHIRDTIPMKSYVDSAVATASGTLQTVTTAGATTTNTMSITGGAYLDVTQSGMHTQVYPNYTMTTNGSTAYSIVGVLGGQNVLYLAGGTGSNGGGISMANFATSTNNFVVDDYGGGTQHFAMKSDLAAGVGDTAILATRRFTDSVAHACDSVANHLVDSVAALSIKEIIPGYGVTAAGTSTVTVGVDTGKVITKGWLYKVVDSVAATVPGTHPPGSPTFSYGGGAGTAPSGGGLSGGYAGARADDLSGSFSFTTGSSPVYSDVIVTFTFNTAFARAPNVFVMPVVFGVPSGFYCTATSVSTTGFSIAGYTSTALTGATQYAFVYWVYP